MDDHDLKNILKSIKAPPPGENARKRDVNLALAEFESARNKNEKKFKGSTTASRLIGRTTHRRRDPMKKKYVYGGLATAMVVVLAATVSFQQLQEREFRNYETALADLNDRVSFEVDGAEFSVPTKDAPRTEAEKHAMAKELTERVENALREGKPGFSTGPDRAARQSSNAPSDAEVSPDYRQRVEETNVERVEQALRRGGSALPTPLDPPKARPAPPADEPIISGEDSRARWQRLDKIRQDHNAVSERKWEVPANATETQQLSPLMRNLPPADADTIIQPGYQDVGRDKFEDFEENPVKLVSEAPVSTFSVDVDTASYAFMRRQINNGVLPQKDAVRIEEMINYFDYDYPLPETKDEPFKPTVTVIPSPWAEGRKLIHIGIKGYDIAPEEKPKSNLVFLLDVSGSMNAPDKLPLLKNSFKLLLESLDENDTVSIVTYAGRAGTVLEPTKGSEKSKIMNALENLNAGGGTAGAEGIRQAYNLAEANFDKNAVNRVILATDGDFNVGISNREELKDFVERKRKSGVFLSVFGFGQGNLNDHMMQTLAQNGNGVAAHIDSLNEARKILVEEASSTLFPIAKDVKIQVEFNPDTVAEYRLIGYETRALNREDFNNDAVDAGDIGAGHTVTAIYEITPVGGPRAVDESRYGQAEAHKADTDFSGEYAFLKIRYKNPDSDTSKLITTPVKAEDFVHQRNIESTRIWQNTAWATAVAGFGQLLKDGKYTGSFSYDDVIDLAQQAKGDDPFGYRAEFINLVRLAKSSAAMAPAR